MKKENFIISCLILIIIFLVIGGVMFYNSNKKAEKFFAATEQHFAELLVACKQPTVAAAPEQKIEPKKLLRDDIYKIVVSHQEALNDCYAKQKNAKSRRMRIALEIQNNGMVTETKIIESDIKNKEISECVTSVIKAIQFPSFDGESVTDEVYLTFDSGSLI